MPSALHFRAQSFGTPQIKIFGEVTPRLSRRIRCAPRKGDNLFSQFIFQSAFVYLHRARAHIHIEKVLRIGVHAAAPAAEH
jgi:hypothetical protein